MKNPQSKNCLHCNDIYFKRVNTSKKSWSKQKFCSIKCTDDSKKNKQLSYLKGTQFKKGVKPWNFGKKDLSTSKRMRENNPMKRTEVKLKSSISHKGKKLTIETRLKQSKIHKQRVQNGLHNFYIDGRTSKNQNLRKSMEYKVWRTLVFQRDGWTCQTCGLLGGRLNAHHIRQWSKFPELRFEVNNGVTLCEECHRLTDSYPQSLKTRKT